MATPCHKARPRPLSYRHSRIHRPRRSGDGAPVTSWSIRKQSFHDPPFGPRLHVLARRLPHPAPPSSPSPAPVVSPSLPMPSRSRSLWRPSCRLRYLGGAAEPRRAAATGKGSCPGMQRSRCKGGPTSSCQTSTWPPPAGWTTDALRSLRMDSPYTMARNWPWTPVPANPALQAALQAARRAKERTYPELVQGNRCRLVVMFMEVGGRWSDEPPPSSVSSPRLVAAPSSKPCAWLPPKRSWQSSGTFSPQTEPS